VRPGAPIPQGLIFRDGAKDFLSILGAVYYDKTFLLQ
jgi:hypothetical protein